MVLPINHIARESTSIDTLVLRTVDQLMPEVKARGLHLDIDLDHVRLPQLNDDTKLAVHSLIANAIQWAELRSEVSITLIDSPGIDTPGQWELEVCDMSIVPEASDEFLLPNNCVLHAAEEFNPQWHFDKPALTTIAAAVRAAERCCGTIEAWHCPQGGIAMILVMPKSRARPYMSRVA